MMEEEVLEYCPCVCVKFSSLLFSFPLQGSFFIPFMMFFSTTLLLFSPSFNSLVIFSLVFHVSLLLFPSFPVTHGFDTGLQDWRCCLYASLQTSLSIRNTMKKINPPKNVCGGSQSNEIPNEENASKSFLFQ